MKKKGLLGRVKAAAVSAAVAATALIAPTVVDVQQADAAASINYAKALQYSLYLYDANMCGTEVGEKGLLKWRNDCHTYDSKVSTPYGTMDLSGGFHDAGDHVKFGLPGAYSATMLGWSYYEFKDAFTQTGQAGHLQTITDYFCDFYRRCIVMDGSNVKAFCYQVGDGDADHRSWQAPEKDTMDRPALFATSSNPCTDVVAETAAALAMNYVNFKNPDDLKYAKALYSFAKTNSKQNHSAAPFYSGSCYLDDLALASIILYKATNDSSYKADCGSWIQQSNWAYTTAQPICWDSVWPAANALYADEWNRVAENVDKNKSNTTSEGYYAHANWGSARYNAALQLEGLVYDKHNNSSSYTSWAKGQMEYLFGSNKNNQCYMVGYDSSSVKYPHHRAASGYTDFPSENRGKAYANVLVGALVGGPDNSGNYYDEPDKYEYTEVALDYNACFVGALAGLYLKYGSGQSVDSSVPGTKSGSTPVITTAPIVTTPPTTTTTVSGNDPIVTTTNKSQDPVITTAGGSSASGQNEVKVDKNLTMNSEISVDINKLVPSGAKAKKFIINLSANGDIGNNISCGGGFTVNSGWQSLENGQQSSSGSKATVTYDVSKYADNIDYNNGVLKFSYWWSPQPSINVDSITCEYTGGSVVTAAPTTTTAPVTSTAPSVTTTSKGTENTGDIDLSKVKAGDINLDGSVGVSDAVLLAKYIANPNKYTLNATALKNADCDGNGKVETPDLLLLVDYTIGKSVKLG